MSVIGGISQLISHIVTSKPKGFNDGMGALGDFDPEQFVNANLERMKNTPGTEINQVTQGIARLLGKKPAAPEDLVGANTRESPLTDDWINGLLK